VQLCDEGTAKAKVRLRLKRPWSDGTTHLVFSPMDFLARLVPLVPPPRMHQVRYHGVLSSHSKLRAQVVPTPPPDDDPQQMQLFKSQRSKAGATLAPAPKHRIRWAKLMARVFGVDPLRCPTCKGTMRIVDFVTEPKRIATIMHWHGLSPQLPTAHRPRGPPQLLLPFAQTAAIAA
jgi:hypothetical protein